MAPSTINGSKNTLWLDYGSNNWIVQLMVQKIVHLHERLRAERESLCLSQPTLANLIGVGKTTVINWEKGSSAPDAEQLSVMAEAGFDVLYVVTGKRSQPVKAIKRAYDEEQTRTLLMLQSRGIYPGADRGGQVSLAGLALLLDYAREAKGGRSVVLTEKELAKVAVFSPSDARSWLLQPVALEPREGGPKSHTILVYRVKTPVLMTWEIGPFETEIPDLVELAIWSHFPLKVRADEDDGEVRWELDLSRDGSYKLLVAGQTVQAEQTAVEVAQKEADAVIASTKIEHP